MEIRGRLIPADQLPQLPVAIIDVSGKQIGAAVMVATYPDGATDNVDFANAALALLGKAANANGLFGTLHKVEVATEAGAIARVEMTLACTADGDTIVYLCANAAVFDVTWRSLNVRR